MFTRDGSGVWNQAAKLTASNPSGDDELGQSVAVDGDTIVVGSPDDQPSGVTGRTGSAYIFVKPVGGWTDGN